MEDVIKRSGNTFGTNEAFILTQLSVAAVPTAAIIFLDIITNQVPQIVFSNKVCIKDDDGNCDLYPGMSSDVCANDSSTWDYMNPESSIISNFDLLCYPTWWLTLTSFVFYLGMILGCVFAGLLSDYIGRKPALMILLFLEDLSLGLLLIAESYQVWLIFRFFTGLFIGYFVVSKVLIVEGLKIQYRHSFLAAIWCCFALGFLFLALLAYVFTKYIDMIACIVLLVAFLWGIYLFGIEESLRWLLVKRKEEQASYLLGKISYRNKVDLPSYNEIRKPQDDDFNMSDLFRLNESRYLMTILVILSIVSFYILVTYTIDVGNTIFQITSVPVNLLVVGVAHLVGVLLAAVSCYFWGRRATVSSLHIIILGLLVIICALSMYVVVTMVSSIGVRCLSAGLVYFYSLYSLEVFATPLRAKAMGIITSGSAVGGLLASFLDFFNMDQDVDLSFQIVTIVAVFVVTIGTFSLRETKGAPLPERIETMPQILPYEQWCQCTADNPENHPLLTSPQFTHIHVNNALTSG
ncbi:hypothetical protein ACHWQZ_G019031 [Mnemiopsis leidyi]